MNNNQPVTIVIFGASGDLTDRKLIPALFNLCRKGRIPCPSSIVGFAGTPFTDESFRQHLYDGMKKYADFTYTEDEWQDFVQNIHYVSGRATDLEGASRLAAALTALESGPTNRLYYMATPPGVFSTYISSLSQAHLLSEDEGWRRVVIEKPFGTDLASARELNRQLHEVLKESQVYRIDHYLGKETVQNILVARFANTIFEPVWNRNYIDHVQITVSETVGL